MRLSAHANLSSSAWHWPARARPQDFQSTSSTLVCTCSAQSVKQSIWNGNIQSWNGSDLWGIRMLQIIKITGGNKRLILIIWNRRNTWTSLQDHDRTWWWCPEDGQETFAQYLRKCSITFIYYSLPVWPGQVVMWRQRLIRLVTFLHTNEPGLVFSEKFILVFITTSMK